MSWIVHAITILLLMLLFRPVFAVAQHEPVVLVGSQMPSCKNGVCTYESGFGNGVIIHADSGTLIVATAGHNIHQGRNIKISLRGNWHDASGHHSMFNQSQDFGVVLVSGDFTGVPVLPIYRGQIPTGELLVVAGYWPATPRWEHRRLRLRRITHQRFGDVLSQPITPGVSGAPLICRDQLAGIVVGIDTAQQPSVTFYTPVATLLPLLNQWGITERMQRPAERPRLLVNEPQQTLPAEPAAETPQASSDAPAAPSGGASESLIPGEALPQEAAESRGTEAPLFPQLGERAKLFAADYLPSWVGLAIGAGVAGPVGVLIPVLWRRMTRSRKAAASAVPSVPVPPAACRCGERVVTVDSPPPPQQTQYDVRYVPVERDSHATAFAWAAEQFTRKYPGAAGSVETLQSLIQQFLSSKGLK